MACESSCLKPAQTLYATNFFFPVFSVLEAGPTGPTERASLFNFVSGEGRGGISGLVYDHPILFTILGEVVETTTLERLAEFDLSYRDAVLPDRDSDRVIFAAHDPDLRIEVFRYSTREKLGEVILDESTQFPRMLRFGDDGLVVAAPDSQRLFLVRTPLLLDD